MNNRTGQEEERITYRYDRQGNLLSDGSLSYVYDGFCRVSEVETAEGGTQKNRYDAEGLRHEMEENGQLVQFLYADREVIAETQSDGNVIRYIRGLGLISSDSEKAKTYYHYVSDEQGSITHVTEGESKEADESQTEHKILNRYRYDAFGNTTDCEETVANRFRYLGEQHDPITQQYYLRARYYNPVIGRFTQEDTYYGDGLNLYQYCAGNPVRYCDPSGHGSVEQNPYKRYTDVGADADTAALAGQAYPDAASKQSLYNKYRNMGYSAENALMLANHEIIHGTASAEGYANNVPKTGTDRTQTSPRDNYSTDWRSQNRANQQRGDGGANTLPDPYALLRERGIPQTLTDAEINATNQAGLRMMAGESGINTRGVGNTNIAIDQFSASDVPSVRNGEFNKFFNALSVDELDTLWTNPEIRDVIEARLRSPGGLHEWHMVSRAPQFKYWGVTAEQIKDLRTMTNDVIFANPYGIHGGRGSTTAHNEILGIIDSSNNYKTFVRRLNNWANYRLEGGVVSLPEGPMQPRKTPLHRYTLT